MKKETTCKENQRKLAHYIIKAYENSKNRESGKIQLDLTHAQERIHCYFTADGNNMNFAFGEIDDYDVKLSSSLYNWLDLANGKLNPVWGVISKKLYFKGNTNIFSKIINSDEIYKISTDISDPPTKNELEPVKNWQSPKKILVINGSPRANRGFTYLYLNRFIQGLSKGDAVIEMVELGNLDIKPCTGCFHCWKNSTGKCIQKDDVNEIYEKYEKADLIIYAFTLYWDTVPGVLKNFIERAFCLEHPYMIPGRFKTRHTRRVKKDKSFFVFSVCGFPEQIHFDSVKQYFQSISHNSHIPFIGGLYRSACMFLHNSPTQFKNYNQVLQAIEKSGESLYKNGRIKKDLVKKVETEVSVKDFQTQANKFWDNVIKKDEYCIQDI